MASLLNVPGHYLRKYGTLILEALFLSKLCPIFVSSLKFKSWMLSNLHFERVEEHDFVLRNLPNRVHPKWVGGTIPFISFSGVGVKHGIFGAQNFLIVQLSLKSKIVYLVTFNVYFFLKIFMSDWQFRFFFYNFRYNWTISGKFVQFEKHRHLNNSRQVWTSLDQF